MTASQYQKAIFSFLRTNETFVKAGQKRKHLIVKALAGSGKSTTLRECIRIATEEYGLSVAYAMFNKDTVEDFKRKNEAKPLRCNVATAHSYGLSAFRFKYPKFKIDKNKLSNLYSEIFHGNTVKDTEMLEMLQPYVCRLASMAKDVGIGIDGDFSLRRFHEIISHHELISDLPKGIQHEQASNKIVEMALTLLQTSNTILDEIDFSDMIYLPLLLKLNFERFDYVLIDEAQDTNATRRALYMRMLKPWGAMIVVGDSHQAIYGFNGADVQSLSLFREELQAESLPLSICYRCSLAVIREAQKIVPAIEACETAPEGLVYDTEYKKFTALLPDYGFGPEDAILCRFNAPNTALAFRLIRSGIPCRIEGRDIGYSIVKLAEMLGRGCDTLEELKNKAITYLSAQVEKHTAAGRAGKAQNITDRVDCLLSVIDRAQELNMGIYGVSKICKELFQDADSQTSRKDVVTLSSIHKAKGREWQRVFILGREDFMPSPWATIDWEIAQEQNLIYVATTRAKETLVKINNLPK